MQQAVLIYSLFVVSCLVVGALAVPGDQFVNTTFVLTNYYANSQCTGLPNRIEGETFFSLDCNAYLDTIDGYYTTACINNKYGIVNCTDEFCPVDTCGTDVAEEPCSDNTNLGCTIGLPTQELFQGNHQLSYFTYFAFNETDTSGCGNLDYFMSFALYDDTCQLNSTGVYFKHFCTSDGVPQRSTCSTSDCSAASCTTVTLPTACVNVFDEFGGTESAFYSCDTTTLTPTPAPSNPPTSSPSDTPTSAPSNFPTSAPSNTPSNSPTSNPGNSTSAPTSNPANSTSAPTTPSPTQSPTDSPIATSSAALLGASLSFVVCLFAVYA